MKKEWYVLMGDQQHGPYTAAEMEQYFRAGQIEPGDLVWRDGMDDWLPVAQVIAGNRPRPQAPAPTQARRPAQQAPELPNLDLPEQEPIEIPPERRESARAPKTVPNAEPPKGLSVKGIYTQKVSPWWWLTVPVLGGIVAIIIAAKSCGGSVDGAESGVDPAERWLDALEGSKAGYAALHDAEAEDRTFHLNADLGTDEEANNKLLNAWYDRWCAGDERTAAKLRAGGKTLFDWAKEKKVSLDWPCVISGTGRGYLTCSVSGSGSPEFLLANQQLAADAAAQGTSILPGSYVFPNRPPDRITCTREGFEEPVLTFVYNSADELTTVTKPEFEGAAIKYISFKGIAEYQAMSALRQIDYPQMDRTVEQTPRGSEAIRIWHMRWCAVDASTAQGLEEYSLKLGIQKKVETLFHAAKQGDFTFQWPCEVTDFIGIGFTCTATQAGAADWVLLSTDLARQHRSGARTITQGTVLVPRKRPDKIFCNAWQGMDEALLTLVFNDPNSISVISNEQFRKMAEE